MRPGQTPVSLLSLLSWGSNETDKTWVSLLSLGTRVSTQTRQTRRSLKEEKNRKKHEEETRNTKAVSKCRVDVWMNVKRHCFLTRGPGGPFCPAGPGDPCSP